VRSSTNRVFGLKAFRNEGLQGIHRDIYATVGLTDFTMQLLQSVGSKSLIVRCGVGMFHPSKDEIYVNLTVPPLRQIH
jgi:hypothetical protein